MDNTCKPVYSTIADFILADDLDRHGDDDAPVVPSLASVLDAIARAKRKVNDQYLIEVFREAFDKAYLPVAPVGSSPESKPEYIARPPIVRIGSHS